MIARENPFSVPNVLKVRYEPQTSTWQEMMDRLQQFQYRAAIVGPEGSGKTTLLEDLAARLSHQFTVKWFSLSENSAMPAFHEIEPQHIVLIDGADILGFLEFRKLLRKRTSGLIITAHCETRLPTLIRCSTNHELLARINRQLIGERAEEIQDLSNWLFARHQGNIRDVLRALYDVWAARP